MDKKERIHKFCAELSQMAEDNGFTSWDFYSALQEMCHEITHSMRIHNEGKELRTLGSEKWKVEYGRAE